jgi:hypothetical protein
MKRHLAPALFSLSLCAVMGGVRTAGAQVAEVAAGSSIDSTTVAPVVVMAPSEIAASVTEARSTLVAPAAVGVRAASIAPADAPIEPAALMADWKMPTSRVLIIGGVATAVVGLVAIGGDTGAIVALSGTAVAVYGLYLHYSR